MDPILEGLCVSETKGVRPVTTTASTNALPHSTSTFATFFRATLCFLSFSNTLASFGDGSVPSTAAHIAPVFAFTAAIGLAGVSAAMRAVLDLTFGATSYFFQYSEFPSSHESADFFEGTTANNTSVGRGVGAGDAGGKGDYAAMGLLVGVERKLMVQ
jgi:hypothetical protein